jgi:signal transduction histidine kinase
MKENTLRLRLTLENLLSWAQSQDGKLIAKKEEFLFSSIINDSIKIASEHIRRKNIKLIQELACNVTVSADKNMIETVVRNLLTNAIKFTNENGQITIRTYSESDLLKCEISDTGIGMSKEELSMLFRLDSHNIKKGTNKETGSGLGLILCKEFMEKNGGTISVSSELGKGSTFSISLPIAGA